MSEKYDRREAELLLAQAGAKDAAHEPARKAAAAELLAAVKGLDGYCGVRVLDDGGVGLDIQLERRVLWIAYSPNEKTIVYRSGGTYAQATLPISFNPALGIFEGGRDDEFIVPLPGQPRARQSALAVIIRYVLDAPAR